MKWETEGGNVSRSHTFAKLLEHIREAQDQAIMLSHLYNTEDDDHSKAAAKGWLMISEILKKFQHQVTSLAAGEF